MSHLGLFSKLDALNAKGLVTFSTMFEQDQNFIETQSDSDQDSLEEIVYDSGNYVNAVASGMVTKLGLKTIPPSII